MLPAEEELVALWARALDPEHRGLPQALAADIGSYTGEPESVVLERMTLGASDFRALWERSAVDVRNLDSLARFYSTQFVEAYELANWHAGVTNGLPPLNYARAAHMVKQLGLKRVLDFGSGIGSGALCFASVGAQVDCADIATDLLRFVEHRLARHGVKTMVYDLNTKVAPPQGTYDLITCFDVLEHVPDQLAKVNELIGYLKVGGYLWVNLMRDSTDANRPMHISSAGSILSLIRKTTAVPVWTFGWGEWQVLQRHRWGRLRNGLAALLDRDERRDARKNHEEDSRSTSAS